MLTKTKVVWSVILVIVVLSLSSCGSSTGAQGPVGVDAAAPAQPVLKTTMGYFIIASAHLVDEVHDQESRPGEEFLLVTLNPTRFNGFGSRRIFAR